MLKDITLGQYFPGDTVIHKLDPRTKLILVIVFIVALFLAVDWISYAFMFLVTAACIKVSTIRLKSILKGLKPLIFIICFTGILNLFYTKGGTVLLDWWIFTITTEGIKRAFLMVVRIMLLITGTFLLTYTTSPIALTDGLEILLNPLKKIKVPVHEMSMIMSMALRFIPTLIEETDKIMSAQKARGADFSTGKITDRAKALLPLLVPLFVSSFRRADELAVAMESRCYHGGEGRTRMNALRMARRDGLRIPVVYNCGGYETVETLRLLDGLVDIYLPDFKYYSTYYAGLYSGAPDYPDVAREALTEMVRQTGAPQFDAAGLMTRGTVVRHLMLPGLAGDTAQVLRYLAEHFGDRILVRLMRQYTPFGMEAYPELDRKITDSEYEDAVHLFSDLGLAGFLQDGESISESFIPAFDGQGV